MKLCLCLADAVSRSEHGTWGVLGLGITRLNVKSFPTAFTGAMVVIVSQEDGDQPGEQVSFTVTQKSKGVQGETVIAGTFLTLSAGEQFVMTMKVGLAIPEPGDYSFRLVAGGVSADVRLRAQPIPGGEPEKPEVAG